MMKMGALAAMLAIALAGTASADTNADEAKAHFQKGLAAYALSNYPEAAAEYEKAFSLKPDPALLYNAAQAHRLAGNQQRALQLYTSYLSVFGRRAPRAAEVDRHIAELKTAIEAQRQAQHSPPTEIAPIGSERRESASSEPPRVPASPPPADEPRPSAPPSLTPSAEPSSASPPSAVESPALQVAAAPPPKPIYKRGWFWGVMVGGAVAVAVGVGLGVGLGSHTVAPTPTMGIVGVQ